MQIQTPPHRYKLPIKRTDRVLEVGSGHHPHPKAQVIVDKFIDSNYHRKTDIKVLHNQEFIQADGADMPFSDNEFDFVICNQVLEHVDDPKAFLSEQSRVAKRGYLETPSVVGEYLFPKESHRWLILPIEGKLIIMDKAANWFDSQFDFGLLFLTYLQRTSMGYKILRDTRPNIWTTRYAWEGQIEFEVNPENPKYRKFFTGPWDEAMIRRFFPEQSKPREFMDAFSSMVKIGWQAVTGTTKF